MHIIILTIALLMVPRSVAAYVDPGLGGQLFQAAYLITIGVAGFLVAPLLLFRRSIARVVRRLFRRRVPPSPPSRV